MKSKILMAFVLGVLVVFLVGASFLTTQQILNNVLVVGGQHINAHLTTQQAINAVYSPADTAINIWLEEVNASFFFQELLQDDAYPNVGSGATGIIYGGFTTFSADSFIMDSLRVLWKTTHNDVYIDSIALWRGFTRTINDATLLMGDGTNIGAGNTSIIGHTYIINQTASFDYRLKIQYWVATSGVAGNGLCYSTKAYSHY